MGGTQCAVIGSSFALSMVVGGQAASVAGVVLGGAPLVPYVDAVLLLQRLYVHLTWSGLLRLV